MEIDYANASKCIHEISRFYESSVLYLDKAYLADSMIGDIRIQFFWEALLPLTQWVQMNSVVFGVELVELIHQIATCNVQSSTIKDTLNKFAHN